MLKTSAIFPPHPASWPIPSRPSNTPPLSRLGWLGEGARGGGHLTFATLPQPHPISLFSTKQTAPPGYNRQVCHTVKPPPLPFRHTTPHRWAYDCLNASGVPLDDHFLTTAHMAHTAAYQVALRVWLCCAPHPNARPTLGRVAEGRRPFKRRSPKGSSSCRPSQSAASFPQRCNVAT